MGYGMIHPNLINAAVLQCNGLTATKGHFDAMSLAPNFDLLLTQGHATEVARLIALWDDRTFEMGDQGDLIVQTPFEPTQENMKYHRDFINPMNRNRGSLMSISNVPEVVAPNLELSWLIPIMPQILQHQGTNIRALAYHLRQCRESPTLLPSFDTQNIYEIVKGVIEDQWLELMSEEDITCLIEEKEGHVDIICSMGKEGRNFLIWNYAGAQVQTGEWKTFHSKEQAWVTLAASGV